MPGLTYLPHAQALDVAAEFGISAYDALSIASLTYYAANDRWSLGLWIKNIEDEAVLAATTAGQFGPYADAFVEPPRTYGLRLTFNVAP